LWHSYISSSADLARLDLSTPEVTLHRVSVMATSYRRVYEYINVGRVKTFPGALEAVVQIDLTSHHTWAIIIQSIIRIRYVATCCHQQIVHDTLACLPSCVLVSGCQPHVADQEHLPGVCSSLLCGMWNWIVLGGLKSSSYSSSSLSSNTVPPVRFTLMVCLPFAGV
jgi:hypothetical protein